MADVASMEHRKVLDALAALDIGFEVMSCDPGLADTEVFCARLDTNKVVRKKMGVRRISFASAQETISLTGMIIGGVTPLPLPDSLPLWVDERVMQAPYIVLGGGDRETKLKISPQLVNLLPNVDIVSGMAKSRE